MSRSPSRVLSLKGWPGNGLKDDILTEKSEGDLEGKWIGFLKDRVTGSLRKCLDEAGNSFENKSKTEINPQKNK